MQPGVSNYITSHLYQHVDFCQLSWSRRCSNNHLSLSTLEVQFSLDNTRSILYSGLLYKRKIFKLKDSFNIPVCYWHPQAAAVTIATTSLWPAINILISSKLNVKLEKSSTAKCVCWWEQHLITSAGLSDKLFTLEGTISVQGIKNQIKSQVHPGLGMPVPIDCQDILL